MHRYVVLVVTVDFPAQHVDDDCEEFSRFHHTPSFFIFGPPCSPTLRRLRGRESYRPGRRHAHHLCTTMIDSPIQNITTCSVWDKSVHRS